MVSQTKGKAREVTVGSDVFAKFVRDLQGKIQDMVEVKQDERQQEEERKRQQEERQRQQELEARRMEKERREREERERVERERRETEAREAQERRAREEKARKQEEDTKAAKKLRDQKEREENAKREAEEARKMEQEQRKQAEQVLLTQKIEEEKRWMAEKKREEEDRKAQAAAAAATSAAAAASSTSAAITVTPAVKATASPADRELERMTGSPAAIARAKESLAHVEKLEEATEALQKEPEFRLRLKAEISKRVNQISCSAEKVQTLAKMLCDTLDQCQRSPAAFKYSENILAKRMIEKAMSEVRSSSQYPAFYIAGVALLVNKKHPTFFKALYGNMIQACPYITPQVHLKRDDESVEEYKKRVGYQDKEDEEKYTERMTSVIALYAAIIQASVRGQQPHPHPLEQGWTWLARILNMTPFRVAPDLIITFIKFAGDQLHRVYKHQFRKLISYLETKYIPDLPKDATSKASRLRTLVTDFNRLAFSFFSFFFSFGFFSFNPFSSFCRQKSVNISVFEGEVGLFVTGISDLRDIL